MVEPEQYNDARKISAGLTEYDRRKKIVDKTKRTTIQLSALFLAGAISEMSEYMQDVTTADIFLEALIKGLEKERKDRYA